MFTKKHLHLTMLIAGIALMTLGLGFTARAGDAPGSVRAEGEGEIWAFGQGKAAFDLAGTGTLTVQNILDSKVTAEGTGQRAVDNDTVTYSEFRGTVNVEGDKIAAHFHGGRVTFYAAGHGSVVFAGTGQYWHNGQGPNDWGQFGNTVKLGEPPVAVREAVVDAEYDVQSRAAVVEIQSYPWYRDWAVLYPEAAVVLVKSRHYHDWAVRFPVAVGALYGHRGWRVWLSLRPHLALFIGRHRAYVSWWGYRDYGRHFGHPNAWDSWRSRYPHAYASFTSGFSYRDWCDRYPYASYRLSGRRHKRDDGPRDRGSPRDGHRPAAASANHDFRTGTPSSRPRVFANVRPTIRRSTASRTISRSSATQVRSNVRPAVRRSKSSLATGRSSATQVRSSVRPAVRNSNSSRPSGRTSATQVRSNVRPTVRRSKSSRTISRTSSPQVFSGVRPTVRRSSSSRVLSARSSSRSSRSSGRSRSVGTSRRSGRIRSAMPRASRRR